MGLEETFEVVREGEHVEVCVVFNNKECYSTFPFGIHFQTLGNSAGITNKYVRLRTVSPYDFIPNEDYVPVNTIVRFSPQQSEHCY